MENTQQGCAAYRTEGLFRGLCKGWAGQSLALALLVLGLSACDSSSGSGGNSGGPKPAKAAKLELELNDIKTFHFSWQAVPDATHYELREYPDGQQGSEAVKLLADKLTETRFDLSVPLYARLNAEYLLSSCNGNGCTDGQVVAINPADQDFNHLVSSIGYFKANNTEADDQFGFAVSLNKDGTVMAVGAPFEDSPDRGVQEQQIEDDSAASKDSGAVYLFRKEADNWALEAYLKAKNSAGGDRFGSAVSLNQAGTVLAVGAPRENSNQAGIKAGDDQPTEAGSGANNSGAVYLFTTDDSQNWQQSVYFKASNAEEFDAFGTAVSLNAAGTALAVGAPFEDSNVGSVINQPNQPTEPNKLAPVSGAVYLFAQSDGQQWQQTAYAKASNVSKSDQFGGSVSLNAAGTVLAVGASLVGDTSTGVENDDGQPVSANNLLGNGAVYLFIQEKDNQEWFQTAYLRPSHLAVSIFGGSVSLNDAGTVLAVGARGDRNTDTEVTNAAGKPDNDIIEGRAIGAVYLFAEDDSFDWSQTAYIKAPNAGDNDNFGGAVRLSGDGRRLAVGTVSNDGFTEAGAATGLAGDDNNAAPGAGAAYSYSNGGDPDQWGFESYIKASNTGAGDAFGTAVALSGDGQTLAVGATFEDSGARGVGGQAALPGGEPQPEPLQDDSAESAGAVYLY